MTPTRISQGRILINLDRREAAQLIGHLSHAIAETDLINLDIHITPDVLTDGETYTFSVNGMSSAGTENAVSRVWATEEVTA